MILVLILTAFTSAIKFHAFIPQSNILRLNPGVVGISKVAAPLRGGLYTCFTANLTIQNQNFVVMVDTGSTDTAIPSVGLNNYRGPTLNYTVPQESTQYFAQYGDKSFWYGYVVRVPVGLSGTNLTSQAPIIYMARQSTEPVFSDGVGSQGLMGVAFSALSSAKEPPISLVDAWFESGRIPNNQIAFHGCPYSRQEDSYIDFGNETPYSKCGNATASIVMPIVSHYNVDIIQIKAGNNIIPLQPTFQPGSGIRKTYSILDSCTSLIRMPPNVVEAFHQQVLDSNAISGSFRLSQYFDGWLNAKWGLLNLASHINFDLLPTFTVTLASGKEDYANVTLVLGGRQYIEVDPDGYCTCL
jgi:hypothetical protein